MENITGPLKEMNHSMILQVNIEELNDAFFVATIVVLIAFILAYLSNVQNAQNKIFGTDQIV